MNVLRWNSQVFVNDESMRKLQYLTIHILFDAFHNNDWYLNFSCYSQFEKFMTEEYLLFQVMYNECTIQFYTNFCFLPFERSFFGSIMYIAKTVLALCGITNNDDLKS
jgi:hypothetical protein